jgi:hypothetical protein
MNKRLEELLERVTHWPTAAQEDAAAMLSDLEERIVEPGELSEADQIKLAALREMVQKSIAEGGDHSDEDVGAMIDELRAKSPFKGR